MERAFVILVHSGRGAPHYDLLLEEGGALATWQLAAAPNEWREDIALPARKLPDHRREYLSYEGPVSKGRGEVKRIDAGTFEIVRPSMDSGRPELAEGRAEEGLWEVRFAGAVVRGRFALRRVGPEADAWELRKLSAAGPAP